MKFLYSVSHHWMNEEPDSFLESWRIVDTDKLIDGFEFHVDLNNKKQIEFVTKMAELCKKDSLVFQVHAAPLELASNQEYLEFYDSLSNIMQQNLLLTIHPLENSKSVEKNILESYSYFNKIFTIIHDSKFNLTLCIENLSSSENKRCDLEDILPIMNNYLNLNFCWDIGHQVEDNECNYYIPKESIYKLRNIHLHDVNNEGKGHYPFYYNNTNLNSSMKYLKSIKYNGSIVVEIAKDFLTSKEKNEQIKEIVEQVKIIKES